MYTNAQVAGLLTSLDARIARIEAAIVAPASAPAQASASAPVVAAATALEAPVKVKVTCATHEKTFTQTPAGSATGSGFHATWCKAGFTPAA